MAKGCVINVSCGIKSYVCVCVCVCASVCMEGGKYAVKIIVYREISNKYNIVFSSLVYLFIFYLLTRATPMTLRFWLIHPPMPKPCYIVWNEQQQA